jgi:hypothetical protein
MPQEAQKTYFLDFLAVLPAAFLGDAFLVFVAFLVAITITPEPGVQSYSEVP